MYRSDGRQTEGGTGTYVSELAQLIGDIVIGAKCSIGHGAVICGDDGKQVYIDLTAKYLEQAMLSVF